MAVSIEISGARATGLLRQDVTPSPKASRKISMSFVAASITMAVSRLGFEFRIRRVSLE